MKRRKKLWIACVALAAVVVLCAFALLYQPVPYRFLEGALLEPYEQFWTPPKVWIRPGETVVSYRLTGTVEDTVEKAQDELTPAEGWDLNVTNLHAQFSLWHESDRTQLTFFLLDRYPEDRYPMADGPYCVVTVVRPASLIDQLLSRLHLR
jgi:hypothetical protein